MTTFASAFKAEITRLARKEIKAQTESMKNAVTQYRHDIAKLKRQVDEQLRRIEFLERQEKKRIQEPKTEDLTGKQRFSSRSVRAQRKRLGLSAEEFGKLLGVSGQTIYNWEKGDSRPREKQFAALVEVRGIGKREAMRRLDMIDEQ